MPDSDTKASKIGGFELLATLGKGGMGVVFKARQVSMDRIVALKVLPPHLAKNEAFVQRFLREARSAAKLNHPNIVQGIDVGVAEGNYYFAMEFVDGTTVKDMIKAKGRLDEKTALSIVGAVARGLEHAHEHGIIHRDIKPDNVMVTKKGEVKLADLGLARSTETPDTMTIEGTALGTPYYMAPEQVRAQSDVDTRADIYALGATLYHMVVGDHAFTGPNAAAIMARHLTDPVPSAKEKCPDVSRATDDLIQRMMAKDREDRPQTPSELFQEVKDALAGKVHLRAKPGTRRQTTEDRRQPASGGVVGGASVPRVAPSSSKTTWIVVAAVAVIAIITAVVVLGRGSTPPDTATSVPDNRQPKTEHPKDVTAKTPEDAKKTSVPDNLKPKTEHPTTSTPVPKVKETPEPKVVEPVPAPKEDAAARAKWDALKADAKKLADAGKFDDALKALDAAKALPLDGIADLVAESIQSIESIKSTRLKAALAAYQAESDKLWALFKQRDYPAADKLLLNLPQVANLREVIGQAPNLREVIQADQEAAKLLKEFWTAVERGVMARKGKFVSVAGKGGNVESVANGQVTLKVGTKEFVQPLLGMDAAQAAAIADLKDDERGNLAKALFLISDGADADAAGKALAAAGKPPGLSCYKDRLDALTLGVAEVAARKAWAEIEALAKEKLTKTSARKLLALLDDFAAKHGKSKCSADHEKDVATLREQANELQEEVAAGPKFFHGKVRRLPGGLVEFLYDWSDPDQLRDWNAGQGCEPKLISREVRFGGGGYRSLLHAASFEGDVEVSGTWCVRENLGGEASCSMSLCNAEGHSYGLVLKVGNQKVLKSTGVNVIGWGQANCPDGQPHTARFVREGASIKVWIDGQLRTNIKDPDYTKGSVGLGSWNAQAGFRDVRIVGKLAPEWLADHPDAARQLGAKIPPAEDQAKPGEWQSLFDGKTLKGWRVAKEFPGRGKGGEVRVEDGAVLLQRGPMYTGLSWTGEFPTMDYELAFEAMRASADEPCLCHVIYPFRDGHAALLLGGKANMLELGAAPHPGARMEFEPRRWYSVLLRVTDAKVQLWIDGKLAVEGEARRRAPDFWWQWSPIKPLGFFTNLMTASVRNIRLRRLGPEAEPRVEAPKAGE